MQFLNIQLYNELLSALSFPLCNSCNLYPKIICRFTNPFRLRKAANIFFAFIKIFCAVTFQEFFNIKNELFLPPNNFLHSRPHNNTLILSHRQFTPVRFDLCKIFKAMKHYPVNFEL